MHVIFFIVRVFGNYQLRKKKKKKIDDTCLRVSAIFLSRNLVIHDEEQNKIMSRVIVQLVRLNVGICFANFLQIYRWMRKK